MRFLLRSLSILALALTFGLMAAERTAHAETLTWKSVVEETLEANPSLKSSAENVNSARHQTKAAYGGFLPQVTGNLDYTNGGRSNSNPGTLTPSTGDSLDDGDNSFYSFSVNARQNVFGGFRDVAKIGQGKANEIIAGANMGIAKAQISYDLKTSFAGLKYAQDFVTLTQDIIKRRKDNQSLVELRYESGSENKGSVLLSQAYLKDAEYDLLQAKDAVDTGRQRLARVLGRETLDGARVSGNVPIKTPAAFSKTKGLENLLGDTPEYRRALGQKKLAKETVRSARSAFYPALDVNAAAGRQGDDWFPEENRWSVGVGVTVPLFNGGADYHTLKSAKARELASGYDQTVTETTVRARLVEAHTTYVESAARLKTDQSFLQAAEVRAEIARSKYNNGLISFEDWDIIESDLISRQKAHLASQRDRVTAEAAWEQAQGTGVFDAR